MKKISSLTIAILFTILMATAFAQMDVPAALQVALFYKIFDFDRSLSEIPRQDIVIGIFYDPDNLQSSQANEEIKKNFAQLSHRGIGNKSVIIKEITTVEQLQGVNIVYVTPGNDSVISEIVKKCQMYKILGITGVEEYAQKGLAITIGVEDQRPKIIINRAGVKSCGEDLSSRLLALAKII